MKWPLTLPLLFLIGCSGLPKEMRNIPYTKISLNKVKTNIPSHKGMSVRWGGTIIDITNQEDSSQAQILFYPINRYGRPRIDRKTEGRFIISNSQFLDPAIYKEGSEITAIGILSGEKKQQVGGKTLTLPLLTTEHIHIWPEARQFDNNYPYHYYPYYSPFSYYHYNPSYNNW